MFRLLDLSQERREALSARPDSCPRPLRVVSDLFQRLRHEVASPAAAYQNPAASRALYGLSEFPV